MPKCAILKEGTIAVLRPTRRPSDCKAVAVDAFDRRGPWSRFASRPTQLDGGHCQLSVRDCGKDKEGVIFKLRHGRTQRVQDLQIRWGNLPEWV